MIKPFMRSIVYPRLTVLGALIFLFCLAPSSHGFSTWVVFPATVSTSFLATSSYKFQTRAERTSASSSSSCLSSSSSNSQETASTASKMGTPQWFQHEISITAPSRGCHLVTDNIQKAIGSDLSNIKIGMANVFIQHTSASLTINENADPSVRTDMETALNRLVPASWNHDGTFTHTMEGDDDMPGHVKTSLMGPSINIPIRNGRLALGTWQGIYLNEHRDQGGYGGGHNRRIIITLQGQS